jgi:hypothetical protein
MEARASDIRHGCNASKGVQEFVGFFRSSNKRGQEKTARLVISMDSRLGFFILIICSS